jgi:hypothetical protein
MKSKITFSLIVLTLGVVSLMGEFLVNSKLAHIYHTTDGKGRLLFGIFEYQYLPYKYGIGAIILVAIVLNLISYRKKENPKLTIFCSLIIVVTSVLLFLRIWKIMI